MSVVLLAVLASPPVAFAASDGSLDYTFSADGKLTTQIGSTFDRSSAIAIQTDGRIIAVGQSFNGVNDDFAVARYEVDGSLDTSFGIGGMVTTPIRTRTDRAYSVAIQTDGKIVVGGGSWDADDPNPNNSDIALARYMPDGSLDPTFGTGGVLTRQIGSLLNAAYSIAIDSSGNVVVGSPYFDSVEVRYDFAVLRFTPVGAVDNLFDTDGLATTKIGPGDETPRSIKIQADGKIVAGGVSSSTFVKNSANHDFAVVRYNSDGSLDPTFGTGGKVTTPIGPGNDDARSIAIQADGKIVAAGLSFNGVNNDFGVVRYDSNGALDVTFGTGGKTTTAMGPGNDDARSIAIQADGKIVAGGQVLDGATDAFGIIRYNPDGSADNSFDVDGKVTTSIGSSAAIATSVAIQTDDKIVAGGYSGDALDEDFALARYSDPRALGVTKVGTGSGSVTSIPVGIDCGPTCTDSFNNGASVTLTASPDPGSLFVGWSGDCAGTGDCTVTMTAARNVIATFDVQPPLPPSTNHSLIVTTAGAGVGSVESSPSGIACGSDCSQTYSSGTMVTLTAAAEPGSMFVGWSGDCSGLDPCTLTMSADRAATARFDPTFFLVNAKEGTGTGTVTSLVAGIDCGDDCSETYMDGTSVMLTAHPSADSIFLSWDGCDSVADMRCEFTMSADRVVTVTFDVIPAAAKMCGGEQVTLEVTAPGLVTYGTMEIDVIVGTPGDDIIYGLNLADIICGLGGDDRLYGGGGNDGGKWGDSLYGGPGRDRLAGDGGDDLLTGGAGSDRLYGNVGHDSLIGGEGSDSLHGNEGQDALTGGFDDDACNGGPGTNDSSRSCETNKNIP